MRDRSETTRLHERPAALHAGVRGRCDHSPPRTAATALRRGERCRIGQNSTSTLRLVAAGPDATVGLRAAGFDVAMAVPWRFTSRTVWVIATDRPYPGYLHELANFIFTTWGMLHIDFFVFVDAAVDPLDPRAVLTTIALEADPDADFHQFGVERMPNPQQHQTPDEGQAEVGTSKAKTATAYIDARPTVSDGHDGDRRTAEASPRAAGRRGTALRGSTGSTSGRADPVTPSRRRPWTGRRRRPRPTRRPIRGPG